jgi:hypothetical protein
MVSPLRAIAFATLMSLVTSALVSACLTWVRGVDEGQFVSSWIRAVVFAWPLVFLSILFIAPLVNRVLDHVLRGR